MARAALRPVGYDERLSLVEHLDELRTRLIICVAAFLVCFGVAFWQNDTLLDIMNRPLEKTAFKSGSEDPFERSANFQQRQKALYLQEAALFRALAADDSLSASSREMLRKAQRTAARDRGRHAGAVGQAAGHARRRRAVHGDLQGRRLGGAAARVPAAALPGIRVHPAGVLPARARGRAAAAARGAVPVRRGRGVRVLHGAPAGDQLPAELQRRLLRHPAAGEGLLLVRDHGADRDGGAVPDPRRDPGGDAHGRDHPAAAARRPPLRDRDHRHHRRAAARPGPGHDADPGRAAVGAL